MYFRNTHVVKRDVDGSEVSVSLEDALAILEWLQAHKSEIESRINDVQNTENAQENKCD